MNSCKCVCVYLFGSFFLQPFCSLRVFSPKCACFNPSNKYTYQLNNLSIHRWDLNVYMFYEIQRNFLKNDKMRIIVDVFDTAGDCMARGVNLLVTRTLCFLSYRIHKNYKLLFLNKFLNTSPFEIASKAVDSIRYRLISHFLIACNTD